MEEIKITYVFDFGSEKPHKYELLFNQNMQLKSTVTPEASPAWTNLDYNKCKNCPLKKEDSPLCPVAKNLEKITTEFASEKSHRETQVGVITKERSYVKKLTLQEGLHSVFGLIMATSGCPRLDFLRPMARFHLPFSSNTETMVRSLSFFLIREYFQQVDGKGTQFDIKNLETLYAEVQQVNLGIIERIRAIAKGDADKNAIVVLDNFAALLSMEIGDDFSELRPIFAL